VVTGETEQKASASTNGAKRFEIADNPVRDSQTVTPEGRRLGEQIEGVRIRQAVTQTDERGSLCEVYDTRWGFTDEPVVYVYSVNIPPGQKRGWVVHRDQDDRMFISRGAAKVALYDARPDSPTFQLVQEIYSGDFERTLLRIPAGVFHGVVNIGQTDVEFVNMPTRPYLHERPDKYRLPHDTDAIPYSL
jgi:dTDP-4-dehydrorhamnose 3,5-epimerase